MAPHLAELVIGSAASWHALQQRQAALERDDTSMLHLQPQNHWLVTYFHPDPSRFRNIYK